MKDHAESEGHIHACQIETSSATALLRGSIAQQLQQVQESERLRNRAAIKSLLRCTHFLAHQHIAHTTNFSELVDLVVSCGGEDLRHFLEKPGKNATYTSKDAVVDFVETIGLWVEECLLKRLCQAQYFSLLADECTDISTIEELSVVVRWVEDGLPVEHFIELVPLKKADANTIYENLIDCLKKKGLMVSNMIGMGFDGAVTFWKTQWSSIHFKSEFTSLNFRTLSLPSLTTEISYTVTAISYNWPAFKLLTVLKVLSMFTPL